MRTLSTCSITLCVVGLCFSGMFSTVQGQSVGLPAPRLLTTTPMGGQAGTQVEVKITGDNLEDIEELRFSHPGISARIKADESGLPVANMYVVSIAADCPPGIHDAYVLTRVGVSSSRVFSVDTLPEVTREVANTSLETAMTLQVGSICNASMTRQAVDHYLFEATAGQRVVVDCAARGIDSKLKPVLIVADAQGNDLKVERRGGVIDFTAPVAGKYVVKVHDLTFNGGTEYFYRLALQSAAPETKIARLPAAREVCEFSWPPTGLPEQAAATEVEPNNAHTAAQKIAFPCDLAGSFYPAADVDTFEFTGKKGEVWWVEVASERLGRPTDPAIILQHVLRDGDMEKLVDLAELSDIASPVKISSNGYAYDGPPYNAGSSDIIGKIEIPEDGTYRLQLSDLFGGTRSDPNNVYRLIVRQPTPDFAIVGWALHMELRNGDRNALSKPIALRGGTTMALEVVAVRRDGFDGDIELVMEDLPDGVTATGLKIPAGKSRGILLLTASDAVAGGISNARFYGRATINGATITRPGYLASMSFPIPDSSQEIPHPRLMREVVVSVTPADLAPLTIAPAEDKVWDVTVGETLTIPLVQSRRSEFSGPKLTLKTFGEGFEGNAPFETPLDAETSQAVLDLAALKTPPGEYTIAFYGGAVAKYRHRPDAVPIAELALKQAQETAAALAAEAKQLAETAQAAATEQQAALTQAAQDAAAKQKAAETAVAAADMKLKDITAKAAPRDIVDIIVSSPIRIRVLAKPDAPTP